MILRVAIVSVVSVGLCLGADKKTPTGQASNAGLSISATLYNDKESVRQLVGSDLGGYIVVVDIKLAPKGDQPLAVSLDDFILRSDKDGQRSRPFQPSQIAGPGLLVVSEKGGGAGIMSEDQGPVFGGGYPGTRPERLGGQSTSLGNTGQSSAAAASMESGKGKDDPLLATLKEKVLAEKETSRPVSGLLYFLMDGKHKTKQLELMYGGPAGKLSLRFQE